MGELQAIFLHKQDVPKISLFTAWFCRTIFDSSNLFHAHSCSHDIDPAAEVQPVFCRFPEDPGWHPERSIQHGGQKSMLNTLISQGQDPS